MKYVSTRGGGAPVDFLTAILSGLAPDGGLYTPEAYPRIAPPRAGEPYAETAARVISAFASDTLPEDTIRELCVSAYAQFSHRSVAPLVQLGPDKWMMELHHGPTLAFKDVAMLLIARLYDHVLGQRGERMTILCATSGDTGGAAAAAFAGSSNIDIVILHPLGRISPAQRRFMTTTGAPNVYNLALEGDFDGTQAILKQLIADEQLRRRTGLAGVNSINWARVAAQSVYYAQAQIQLGAGRRLRFVVPTGNFGDALAAYVAHRCGLLATLDIVTAVNANGGWARAFASGRIERAATQPTLSPAMDIQVPSNLERLLFEAAGRKGETVAAAYRALAAKGAADLPTELRQSLSSMGIVAEQVGDAETLEEMRHTYAETGWIVCPHTAVGVAASRRRAGAETTTVCLATAHAAKFPETVKEALGFDMIPPARAAALDGRVEIFDTGPMDAAFVRARIEAIAGAR